MAIDGSSQFRVAGRRTRTAGTTLRFAAPHMISRRSAFCAGAFIAAGLLPLHAILDYSGRGVSYLWELQHPEIYDLDWDNDGDGATNGQEAIAGTDPKDAAHRFTGTMQSGTGGALALKWFGQRGKEYRIEASADLQTWTAFSGPFIGTGAEMSQPVQAAGAAATARRYWRVTVQDRDGDADGISDWEEYLLKTNPQVPNASPIPPARGYDADRPAFVFEKNGIYKQAYLGGPWPQQLFWEDVAEFEQRRNEGLGDVASIEAKGLVPAMGGVTWGIELVLANGGDPSRGYEDWSQKDGYKQYAAWMNPRKDDYFALNADGAIAYPEQGYVSFGMPLLPADLPAGKTAMTFGEWAGERLGRYALRHNIRALYGADGFIGINPGADWHPRLLDSFAAWVGQPVLGATVRERYEYILQHLKPEYFDFIAHKQAGFFAAFANTLLAAGKTPLVGGQVPNEPANARVFGDDPRIWLQHIEAKHTMFNVETQSAGDRAVQPQWTSSICLGHCSAYEPDANIGVVLDADNAEFWGPWARDNDAVEFGWRFLKHNWLSAGWVHIAGRDGAVRRAAKCITRTYWDAGAVDVGQMAAVFGHIPRHPFGPALYYSASIQREFERPPEKGYATYSVRYMLQDGLSDPAVRADFGAAQGLSVGYWVSDAVDPSKLPAANRPSAWLVYRADLLPAAERAKLEAVAPVIDPGVNMAAALAVGPLRARGSGLSCLAFVDQNGAVVVMVSNCLASATTGSLDFSQVGNGTFACNGLLGTPSAALTIAGNRGSLPITVAARDTLVFEIPGLKWLGH